MLAALVWAGDMALRPEASRKAAARTRRAAASDERDDE
jgi:hypothetical protein